MPMPKKPRTRCLNCGNEPSRSSYKYCSNACQIEYQYKVYIRKWKYGQVSGLQNPGIVSRHVKRYLRRKYDNKCCICSWSEKNALTNEVPLVADHIDGNWRNNTEENLRLICPNCDSLTSTYAGLNRGRGRKGRVASLRAQESKKIIKS